jgi:hypothetical protein
MTVNIIWSLTNGGEALTDLEDLGSIGNGSSATDLEIFVRHDGGSEITDAAIYMRQWAGTYTGSFTAASDFAELIGWGDASTANGFGGVLLNLNATTVYATGWPTYSSKSPTGGVAVRTGVSDSEGNATTLPTSTGCSSAGVVPAGSAPNVRFKMRASVPSDEDTSGIREWELALAYNYTS